MTEKEKPNDDEHGNQEMEIEPPESTLKEKDLSNTSVLNPEIDTLKDKLSCIEEDLAEAKDSVLRAHAEMENIRRRAQKDIEDAYKYSLEKFTDELLPVLDSMEKAVESALSFHDTDEVNTSKSSIIDGVELTMKMLSDKMEKFGVKQINPKGKIFDPNKHEAIAMQSHPDFTDNQVMDVFQKGYELNNRIIRPARVVVVKNT
jgi:molecular chaperone GrpE